MQLKELLFKTLILKSCCLRGHVLVCLFGLANLAWIPGDYCLKVNVTILGFYDYPAHHNFSGIYVVSENETTDNGRKIDCL